MPGNFWNSPEEQFAFKSKLAIAQDVDACNWRHFQEACEL